MMGRAADLGTLIVEQIRNALDAGGRQRSLTAAKVKELEAEGYRIVAGDSLTITDWRTGEVLAKENDKWPENWAHIDPIEEESFDSVKTVLVKGLSKRLAEGIEELAVKHEHELRSWLETGR